MGLSPAFMHGGADLWSHPSMSAYGATAEQQLQLQLQLHQQALLHHPAQQLPVRSFL